MLLCAGGPIGLEHLPLPVEKMRATMTQQPVVPRSEPPAPPPVLAPLASAEPPAELAVIRGRGRGRYSKATTVIRVSPT